jgi:hypothetical protein
MQGDLRKEFNSVKSRVLRRTLPMLRLRARPFFAMLLIVGLASVTLAATPKGAINLEADRTDEAMAAYEIAKAEYDAWWKLKTVHKLFAEARKQARQEEKERLAARAKERAEEIVEWYNATSAVADAQEFIDGKQPRLRPAPRKPLLPKGIWANENEYPRERKADLGPNDIPPGFGEISALTGRPKTVLVRGYFRQDGTYVRPHWRSPPENEETR